MDWTCWKHWKICFAGLDRVRVKMGESCPLIFWARYGNPLLFGHGMVILYSLRVLGDVKFTLVRSRNFWSYWKDGKWVGLPHATWLDIEQRETQAIVLAWNCSYVGFVWQKVMFPSDELVIDPSDYSYNHISYNHLKTTSRTMLGTTLHDVGESGWYFVAHFWGTR